MAPKPDWADDESFGEALDPVEREAVAWFVTINSDAVSNADKAAFRAWLRRDADHAAAYEEIARIWSGAAELPLVKERRRASRARVSRRTLGKLVLAAGIGGAGWALYRQHPLADYRTGAGERRALTLPDGSGAELAAASALSIDFRPERRLVRLLEGEAFFTVAPNQAPPFVVEAQGGMTRALGTAFNIAHEPQGVRVVVAKHAVELRLAGKQARVEAGHGASYGDGAIGPALALDVEAETAWREGRLVFLSAPFGRVIASLNRWLPGRLVLMSSSLAERPVTLIVDLHKSENVLATLEDALPIRTVHLTPYLTFVFAA